MIKKYIYIGLFPLTLLVALLSCATPKNDPFVTKKDLENMGLNAKVSFHPSKAAPLSDSDRMRLAKLKNKNKKVKSRYARGPKKYKNFNCSFKKKIEKAADLEKVDPQGRLFSGLWNSENAISLKYFPRDKFGYYPDWVAAVEQGIINPLGSIDPNNPEEKETQPDMLMAVKSPIRADICFPHSVHAYWLRCSNCHPEIFIPKRNANPISMTKIIKGEFCGRCHGVVAFHVANNCHRCHNTPK